MQAEDGRTLIAFPAAQDIQVSAPHGPTASQRARKSQQKRKLLEQLQTQLAAFKQELAGQGLSEEVLQDAVAAKEAVLQRQLEEDLERFMQEFGQRSAAKRWPAAALPDAPPVNLYI